MSSVVTAKHAAKVAICLLLASLLFLTLWQTPVHAEQATATGEVTKPPYRVLNNGIIDPNTSIGIEAKQYLRNGYAKIVHGGNLRAYVYGETHAYSTVDSIAVELFIQRWDGTKWTDTFHVGTIRGNQTSSVSGGWIVRVGQVGTYRVTALHWIAKGAVFEQLNSTTPGILID